MSAANITQLPTPRRLSTSVKEDVTSPGMWRVEAVDYAHGGIAELTVFVGGGAEQRARAYAQWLYRT
jgi:hypothetical protein